MTALSLLTSAKTLYLNKVLFTGTGSEDCNIFFIVDTTPNGMKSLLKVSFALEGGMDAVAVSENCPHFLVRNNHNFGHRAL